MLEGKEGKEEKEEVGGDTLLDEEGRLRDIMTKCMRGRRERGNKVGSTASHWISLMLPAENRGGEGYYVYTNYYQGNTHMYKYLEHSNTYTLSYARYQCIYKQLFLYYSTV